MMIVSKLVNIFCTITAVHVATVGAKSPKPNLARGLNTKSNSGQKLTDIIGGGAVSWPPSIKISPNIKRIPTFIGSAFDQASLEAIVDASEVMSWMTSILLMGCFYNSVGTIASKRNVDFTEKIATTFDYRIPVVPFMIVPYVLVYALPYAYTASSISKQGLHRSLANIRRFFLTQHILMASAYALYILFPVSISSFGTEPPGPDTGLLQKYTYNFVNRGMTTFCACPSMHVAHTLSMALIQHADNIPGAKIAMVGAFATFFSTVLTRAHFIMDVPFGIAFALLINHGVFKKLRGKLHPAPKGSSSPKTLFRRFFTGLVAPLALGAIFVRLEKLTGSKTDMLGMIKGDVRT